jgi:hypothetical protein
MKTLLSETRSPAVEGKYTADLSMGWRLNGSRPFGSLEDPIAGEMPYLNVPINVLDLVAGALMMVFVLLSFYQNEKKLWAKVFFCHAILCVCKGIIDVTTTEPDSSGWGNCIDRLGGQSIVNEFTNNFHPSDGYLYFFIQVAEFEMFGFNYHRILSGVRFCSDMMLSGHTFVTCLYALGNCELFHRIRQNPQVQNDWLEKFIRGRPGQVTYIVFVGMMICEQLLEISLVLSNRFHYTADVVVALLATFALYTNGPLAIYAEWFASSLGEFNADEVEGNIWVPPCCIPFCDPHGDCLGLNYGHHKLKWVDATDDELSWKVELERVRVFGWQVRAFEYGKFLKCKEGVIVCVRQAIVAPEEMKTERLLPASQFEYLIIFRDENRKLGAYWFAAAGKPNRPGTVEIWTDCPGGEMPVGGHQHQHFALSEGLADKDKLKDWLETLNDKNNFSPKFTKAFPASRLKRLRERLTSRKNDP